VEGRLIRMGRRLEAMSLLLLYCTGSLHSTTWLAGLTA
jgi:hypothetical protein